ncbi:hypothetical protein [Algivirga pacifica]
MKGEELVCHLASEEVKLFDKEIEVDIIYQDEEQVYVSQLFDLERVKRKDQ